MTGAEAFHDAWLALAEPPTGLAAVVKLLGGSKKVASLLQVAQRTVQRYLNREKVGKTKYNRLISRQERTFLQDLAQKETTRRTVAEIRKRGLSQNTFATGTIRVSNTRWHGTAQPVGGEGIPARDLGDMCDAVLEEDWAAAWEEFQANLLIAYDIQHDVADMEFEEVDIVHLDIEE